MGNGDHLEQRNSKIKKKKQPEGYIYTSYGNEKYLKDAIISAFTIRRFDTKRPIALFCSKKHKEILRDYSFRHPFDIVSDLEEEHQSITGFKHNLHAYMPFDKNMYLDSDMIFCRPPDNIWIAFRPFPYTITGQESADVFFGSHKNFGIALDILLGRRQRTLKRFDLTYLARVQTGIMYAADYDITKQVNDLAKDFLNQKSRTHFVSRKKEKGRSLESCEWSLGMAVSRLNIFIYPWFNAQESFQLDFIHTLTKADPEYRNVACKYYCNPFVHSLRGINNRVIQRFLLALFKLLPRGGDHIWVTPYILHFGWRHQKSYFNKFVEQEWNKIT